MPLPAAFALALALGQSPVAELPEIGRVTSAAPACAAINDLVVPAYAAMRTADGAFASAVPSLAAYAATAARERNPNLSQDPLTTMYLMRIGQSVATQEQALRRIERALGDPRFQGPPGSTLDDERRHLEAWYAVQSARTNALWEFWLERSTAAARKENADLVASVGNPTAAQKRLDQVGKSDLVPDVASTPLAIDRTAFGQPTYSGAVGFVARDELTAWAAGMTRQVRNVADLASRYFLPLAKSCTAATAAPSASPAPPR